ncbi:MAG: GNAT family N-acetyltransferase [Pseudomonadota bacterium]
MQDVPTFRDATGADRESLGAILLKAHRHYWGEGKGDRAMAEATATALLDGSSGCQAILALVAEAPRGFATISVLHPGLSASGTLFLKDLFVSDEARGTGLGRALMRHIARRAVALGCQRFDWTAETDNPAAIEFYDALGARRVEEKVYFRFSGEDLTAFAAAAPDLPKPTS